MKKQREKPLIFSRNENATETENSAMKRKEIAHAKILFSAWPVVSVDFTDVDSEFLGFLAFHASVRPILCMLVL